ncbi:sucrose utilization protein SUC1-like protein 3 [Seiridium cupressi]
MQYNDAGSASPPRPGSVTTSASAPHSSSTSPVRVKKEEGVGVGGIGRIQLANASKRTEYAVTGDSLASSVQAQRSLAEEIMSPRKEVPSVAMEGSLMNSERRSRKMFALSRISIDADNYNSAPTSAAPSAAPSPPAQPFIPWTAVTSDPREVTEPKGAFTSDVYQPRIRDYLYLIPTCVDLYYEHIYPIMPLVHMPTIRNTISRPMTCSEKNLVYALSALTSFHMAGKSLAVLGQPSWDEVGRFFLDECIYIRQKYDFLEDTSLSVVISSFWLSTSFFEINQSRKSWFYLREALTLAIDIRLHDDSSYVGLSPAETLCRQRVFWILFVTERSFAILRNKPLTLRKTPSLPTMKHEYEAADIHVGFMKLVTSYIPLDESFVAAWNDGSDPGVSAATYLNLQRLLAQPLDFLRPKRKSPSPPKALLSNLDSSQDDDSDEPDPTSIQKADLMITQQWLRLIVWQSSFRQGLLSTAAEDESFSFSFPLSIARDTAAILQSLPSRAVEVHGMGIFEKIFEIGTWSVNVMGAYDSGTANPARPFGGASEGVAGMDYVGGGLSLFRPSGRSGAVLDPLEFFIKTLSASPNSKTIFADKLLMFAEQTPGGMRTNLSPAITPLGPTRESSWNVGGGVMSEAADKENTDGIIGSMDLTTEPLLMDTDNVIGMAGVAPAPSLGRLDSVSTDDLDLSIVTSRSSMYSISDNGPLSAGLSNAFSDLSTGGSEYRLSDMHTNDMTTGVGTTGATGMTGMHSSSAWGYDPEHERKLATSRTATNTNAKAERVLGIW